MSINVSEKQLHDQYFFAFVSETLKAFEIEPNHFNIEITERALINLTDTVVNTLTKLKKLGIKIVIDDFGTKYSCLNYLYSLPVSGIKIDKSFIDKIQDSEKEIIVIKNIIKLAEELNIEVIAEGVEKEEQLKCLTSINCNKIQGYIFGKPVSSEDFAEYIRRYNSLI